MSTLAPRGKTSHFLHTVTLDFRNVDLLDEHIEWWEKAFSRITLLPLTNSPPLSSVNPNVRQEAFDLFLESATLDRSGALTRELLRAIGIYFHEVAHQLDLTRSYLGYELFFYSAPVLVASVNIVHHALCTGKDPLKDFSLSDAKGFYRSAGNDASLCDTLARFVDEAVDNYGKTVPSFCSPRMELYSYSQNTILEFSSMLKELGTITFLFGKHGYEIYVEDILGMHSNRSAITLYNEFLFAVLRKGIELTSPAFIEAIDGCSRLINASLNGTTMPGGALSDGPEYSQCFYSYFYEWLNYSDLNIGSSIACIDEINRAFGYLSATRMCDYLSEYAAKHALTSSGRRLGRKCNDNRVSLIDSVVTFLESVEDGYRKTFASPPEKIWDTLRIAHLASLGRLVENNIYFVIRGRKATFLAGMGALKGEEEQSRILEIAALSAYADLMFFGDDTLYPIVEDLFSSLGHRYTTIGNPFF